jgi:DNA-binding protein HU-beta
MTRNELINEVEKKTGLTHRQCERSILALFDVMTREIAHGEKIQVLGFGTFELHNRAARQGINPRTGEIIDLPACNIPYFKAGKSFKSAANR